MLLSRGQTLLVLALFAAGVAGCKKDQKQPKNEGGQAF